MLKSLLSGTVPNDQDCSTLVLEKVTESLLQAAMRWLCIDTAQ